MTTGFHKACLAGAAVAIVIASSAPITASEPSPAPGALYAYPTEYAVGEFKPHELGFHPPRDQLARAAFFSQPFYAIILKSGARCSLREAERREIQTRFADRKVFMNRFQCDDGEGFEENIGYEGTSPDYSFLAVYAGDDLAAAKALFERARVGEAFPGANIRRMRAYLAYP